jgi:transposase-like protein
VVKEYEQSGLTQVQFARRSGLAYTTFAHWVQRSRREAKASMRSARACAPALRPGFVEVRAVALPEPALPASELSVTLPDGVVLRGCDPVGLATLLRALRVNES